MPGSPLTKWLRDDRRSLLGWSIAIVLVGSGYAAFWPTIDSPEVRDALESYPEGLLEALDYDVSSAAGYLSSTVYGLLAAVLLLVHAVGAGSRAIAGDEEAGTLELILAHPVRRSAVALGRFAAITAGVVGIVVLLLLALLALTGPVGLSGITVLDYAAMHLHLALFAVLFGAVAFSVGAATGRRAPGVAVAAAIGVLGYVANGIIPQVEGLAWVRNLSPFHWLIAGEPLENGVQPGAAVMGVLAVGLVAVGTWAFTRRDVGV